MESIQYRINTATKSEICTHLQLCDTQFVPYLSKRVDIKTYSEKLAKLAYNFEAWNSSELIGLVAVYMNDENRQKAFVTSVSVIGSFLGKGIASVLLKMSIEMAKKMDFYEVALEVDDSNVRAKDLYNKIGFSIYSCEKGITTMIYSLN